MKTNNRLGQAKVTMIGCAKIVAAGHFNYDNREIDALVASAKKYEAEAVREKKAEKARAAKRSAKRRGR